MTFKHYHILRLLMVMALSAFIAFSVVQKEFFWPVVAIAIAMLVLLFLRRRVKGVLADERDYTIGGKAALWSIQIFSGVAVVLMFVLLAKQDADPSFRIVADVLAYATCALMLLYSLIFAVLRRRAS